MGEGLTPICDLCPRVGTEKTVEAWLCGICYSRASIGARIFSIDGITYTQPLDPAEWERLKPWGGDRGYMLGLARYSYADIRKRNGRTP